MFVNYCYRDNICFPFITLDVWTHYLKSWIEHLPEINWISWHLTVIIHLLMATSYFIESLLTCPWLHPVIIQSFFTCWWLNPIIIQSLLTPNPPQILPDLLLHIRIKAIDCQIILNQPHYLVAVSLGLKTNMYIVRTVDLVTKIMVNYTFIS
jgi:hypothetical protein